MTSIKTKEELIAHLAQGHVVDYLLFWGHTAKDKNSVGKECLSQWYPAGFAIDGIHYPTAEHYMMAEKARLFGDDAALQKILNASDPHAAKQIGREVKHYTEEVWKQHRIEIVVRANTAKFAQNQALTVFLQSTGDQILVEASPVDRVWGIGFDEHHPDAHNPAKWRGLNLLGFALMAVRGVI
jgi:ribA/ribD-fused uncharacterized protein